MTRWIQHLWRIIRPVRLDGEASPVYWADLAAEESQRAMARADEMVARWDHEDRVADRNWLANELDRTWGKRRE